MAFGVLARLREYAFARSLWLAKAAVLLIGQNELALRLVPLLACLVSMVLFAMLARRILGPWAALAAATIFAASPERINYANETKQYALDVAFALAVIYLAVRSVPNRLTLTRAILLGAVGTVGIFCSHRSSSCWLHAGR